MGSMEHLPKALSLWFHCFPAFANQHVPCSQQTKDLVLRRAQRRTSARACFPFNFPPPFSSKVNLRGLCHKKTTRCHNFHLKQTWIIIRAGYQCAYMWTSKKCASLPLSPESWGWVSRWLRKFCVPPFCKLRGNRAGRREARGK